MAISTTRKKKKKPEDIQKIDENKWLIYGCADIDDVSEELAVDLPVEIYDTFGGFICGLIAEIPEDGKGFAIENREPGHQKCTVCKNHRIGSATVVKK